ncbi:MAG: hypothetical protein KDB00_21855 [Planctomycetales bacterium]|nr:hypothetical protein [Planctomycetales bacterium]
MNGNTRNRMKLRRQGRVALVAMMLCTTATTAGAETQTNPYFQNSTQPNKPITKSTDRLGMPERVPRRLPRVDKETLSTSSSIDRTGGVRVGLTNPTHNDQLTSPSEQTSALGVPVARSGGAVIKDTRMIDPGSAPLPGVVSSTDDARLIAAAARRQAILSSASQTSDRPASGGWLQSVTAESCNHRAAEFLDDAYREYSVHAWASAEASAWKALELVATGIDIDRGQRSSFVDADQTASAGEMLRIARTAISESRDFVTSGAAIDGDLLRGIASSHQTKVLSAGVSSGMTAIQAVDGYLDHARLHLAPLASASVQAAQAMDLLAAIQLGRNEAKWIPEETSLCLRRAALQGQPSNASLASRLGMQLAAMGLDDEADMTLRHAMKLDPSDDVAKTLAGVMERRGDKVAAQRLTANVATGQPDGQVRNRIPEVIQLTPQQFASISPPLNAAAPAASSAQVGVPHASAGNNPAADTPTAVPVKRGSRFIPASLAGFRLPFTQPKSVTPPSQQSDPLRTIVPPIESVDIDSEINQFNEGIYDDDDFNAFADSVSEDAGQPSSPVKRFINKLPKLW